MRPGDTVVDFFVVVAAFTFQDRLALTSPPAAWSGGRFSHNS